MDERVPGGVDGPALLKYFRGECAPGEARRIAAWIEVSYERREWVASLRELWEQRPWDDEVLADPTEPLQRLQARLAAKARRLPAQRGRPLAPMGAWIRRPATVFAAGALAASFVAVMIARLMPAAASFRPGREYVTAAGQRETVTLADGTELTLAPASRLRLGAGYDDRGRDVYLEGEAYFSVVHDTARPFSVHSGNAVARDIGTRFVVRSYPEDTVVRVVVADGTVSLGDAARHTTTAATLGRGMMGAIGRSGATTVTPAVNVDTYVGWREGELVFAGTPALEAARELERWYGISVRLAGHALDARRLDATFKDEPPRAVIYAIATALGATATWDGRTVTIAPGAAVGR